MARVSTDASAFSHHQCWRAWRQRLCNRCANFLVGHRDCTWGRVLQAPKCSAKRPSMYFAIHGRLARTPGRVGVLDEVAECEHVAVDALERLSAMSNIASTFSRRSIFMGVSTPTLPRATRALRPVRAWCGRMPDGSTRSMNLAGASHKFQGLGAGLGGLAAEQFCTDDCAHCLPAGLQAGIRDPVSRPAGQIYPRL